MVFSRVLKVVFFFCRWCNSVCGDIVSCLVIVVVFGICLCNSEMLRKCCICCDIGCFWVMCEN